MHLFISQTHCKLYTPSLARKPIHLSTMYNIEIVYLQINICDSYFLSSCFNIAFQTTISEKPLKRSTGTKFWDII